MKYVENSGVVVYLGVGSFKITSESEELLAGVDIEGILAVIDNDVLAEPNDLELSSQLQFPKYRTLIQRAVFMPKLQKNN